MGSLAGLTDAQLADLWLGCGLKIPDGLVDETIRRGGRMTPFLGRMIIDRKLWDTPEGEPKGWAPVHALHLILAIKDPAAAPFVEKFLREDIENSWIMEAGDALVHSLGPGEMERMWAVALDPKVGSASRAAVVDGFTLLGLAHEPLRADLISRYRARAQALLDRRENADGDVDDLVLDSLLRGLACLHDEDSRELIDRACSDDEIGFLLSEKEEIQKFFREPFEELLRNRLGDPLDHFDPKQLADLESEISLWKEEAVARALGGGEGDDAPFPIVNMSPKVGRNDPCPCGSGKKYKKCCME